MVSFTVVILNAALAVLSDEGLFVCVCVCWWLLNKKSEIKSLRWHGLFPSLNYRQGSLTGTLFGVCW